jgi:hypothetical protein
MEALGGLARSGSHRNSQEWLKALDPLASAVRDILAALG